MKKNIFTCILILIQSIAFSQNAETPDRNILTKQQVTNDYNILYESLINFHPKPFAYITESDFKTFFENQKSYLPDTTNELEFHYLCRQLISQIKCGHTFARPSNDWYASLKDKNVQLPFDIKNIDGRLYFNNTIDEKFDFAVDDELLSINGMTVEEILHKMSLMQERDGFTLSFMNALIEKRFRTYLLFIMGIQKEYLIEYKTNSGEVKKVTVSPTNKKLNEINNSELPSNFTKILTNDWSNFYFDDANNLAYLKINHFSDRKEFKEYYKSVFKYLKEKPNSKLIIDIRDNPGGYFGNGNNFLTYLTPNKFELTFQEPKKKKPKNEHIGLNKWSKWTKVAFSLKPSKRKVEGQSTETFTYKPSENLFEGKVYVMTNGITFSQAALVAAQLKEYGAVFFGQETGGAEIGCNGILNYDLVLPNSKIAVTIPVYHVNSNSNKGEFGYGVKPNYLIQPILGNPRDYTLEEAMKIIKGIK